MARICNKSSTAAMADYRFERLLSPWVFVLLLIVFWPAAVAYAVWKSGVFLSREATTP